MQKRKNAEAARWLTTIALVMFVGVSGVQADKGDLIKGALAIYKWIKADNLNDGQINKIAREVAPHIERDQGGSYTDRRLSAVSEEMLRAAMVSENNSLNGKEFRFRALHSDEVNALSLPNGYLYANRGLMERMIDDELAGVMAHEIAHVALGHGKSGLKKAMKTDAIISPWGKGERTEALKALGQYLVNAEYSREQEKEADIRALKYLSASRYPVNSLSSALNKLGGSNVPKWLSTHPPTPERIVYLNAEEKKYIAGTIPEWGLSPSTDEDEESREYRPSDSNGLDSGFRRNDNGIRPLGPTRPRQRVAIIVEDASQGRRGGMGYGSGRMFFYDSPSVIIPPILITALVGDGRFTVSDDAPILIVLSMTHYQMIKGLKGQTDLGNVLGSRINLKHEQVTAILNAELRIETPEGIVWAIHLSATETGVLNDVEIREGKWWSGKSVSAEWWKTPAGKATRGVCDSAARILADLDFSRLLEQTSYLVAAVREVIYVTSDGGLQVGDRLMASGGPITHPETGELLGYEIGAELEVIDVSQPRLAVCKLVNGLDGKIVVLPRVKDRLILKSKTFSASERRARTRGRY